MSDFATAPLSKKFIEIDGKKMAYHQTGEGRPVVFLHGNPTSSYLWRNIIPIVAKNGGVLVRAGHTEASVDISKLAKCGSSAVICEIMNDDGTMAKGNQLLNFAKKHKLKIGKIDDLISYRLNIENFTKLKKR